MDDVGSLLTYILFLNIHILFLEAFIIIIFLTRDQTHNLGCVIAMGILFTKIKPHTDHINTVKTL